MPCSLTRVSPRNPNGSRGFPRAAKRIRLRSESLQKAPTPPPPPLPPPRHRVPAVFAAKRPWNPRGWTPRCTAHRPDRSRQPSTHGPRPVKPASRSGNLLVGASMGISRRARRQGLVQFKACALAYPGKSRTADAAKARLPGRWPLRQPSTHGLSHQPLARGLTAAHLGTHHGRTPRAHPGWR